MPVTQIVNVRRIAAAGALAIAMLSARAQAEVLEQVPSDAMAVFEIKSLDGLNTKVAKMAKTFGLDEINPDMKDPLSSLLEKGHISKGINKAGDAAMVIFAPDMGNKGAEGFKDEPVAVALVSVSDYDAFLGNFEKADGNQAGDISSVKDPVDGGKTMFIAHRGTYAIMSDKKDHLAGKKLGLKLSDVAAHEIAVKDAVFVINIPAVRAKVLPEFKAHRKEWIDQANKMVGQEEKLKQFQPVFDTLINEALDVAQNFLQDSSAIVFSVELSDEGLTGSGLVEFTPGSKYGNYVTAMKPGTTPLLAGLPNRKYFAFGGSSQDPKSIAPMVSELIDPLIKGLNDTDNDTGKRIATALETVKTMVTSSDHQAEGIFVPTKPLGQESILQQITISHGDAKALAVGQKKLLGDMSDLMALAPQQKGMKTKIVMGEPKTIGDATLQTYTTKFDGDENDPQAMQVQQMMAMMYGPNGASGTFGAVDDNIFVVAQGVSDELLKETIDAAKGQKDVLSDTPGVKAVSSHLPKHSSVVLYVALDNIVTTAVRYAQGFGVPVKMKLPANLPPIGMSSGPEGSAMRADVFVPTQTVQSLVAAGIQTYTQMQQGGNGGGL